MTVNHPSGIQWREDLGYGYYPVQIRGPYEGPYNESYWEEYRERDHSAMGKVLTDARIDIVDRYVEGPVVDIGIGGGRFVEDRNRKWPAGWTFGYDVNPSAILWLLAQRLWWDPYFVKAPAAAMWDVLEHMDDPEAFLKRIERYLFVSIPIFDGLEHASRSKHFKKAEHKWYFTYDGFVRWALGQGFELLESSRIESSLGREGITTFALKRIDV